ncbi:MAG: 3-hydroxyacyl-CoA dehydrogenase NAD-binding domain-containing protein [Pirellulales bacterium]
MKNSYFETEVRDDVLVIWLDQQESKVNKISPEMIGLFEPLLDELDRNQQVRAAVLISRKKDFIAGADIEAFANVHKIGDWKPIGERGHAILFRIQASRKPIVAAIHGACMGAGAEIALACSARVAADEGTVIALPEVKLGLLPGGGGTQRLPKLVGIQRALEMMLNGKNIYAYPAKKMGLVDRLATRPALLDAALCLAGEAADQPLQRKDPRPWIARILEGTGKTRDIIYKKAERLIDQQTKGNYPAPYEIIECVRAGSERGSQAGFVEEVTRFEKLILTPESRQLRNVFFAMTDKKKNPLKDSSKTVKRVGILGAGFMGAGIAEVTVAKDIGVVLKDIKHDNITKAKQTIWQSLKTKLDRRAISSWEADQQMSRLIGQFDYAGFNHVDLVIEAVFEEIGLKQKVLAECEQHLRDDAIYASNTSALPISEIAQVATRPERVIGMHYFSPVPKMPLLEIVATDKTADWVIGTCYELGLQQGKTVIVVKDGPGFYTTRILAPMMAEALNLLHEGVDIVYVDRLLAKFGFPVGPFTLMDEVGIDVGAHIMTGHLMQFFSKTRPDMLQTNGLVQMYNDGFQGRKNRRGFYQYDESGKKISGKANHFAYNYFRDGASQNSEPTDQEIVQRISWSLIAEAARCLEEQILSCPLDGDVGAVFGLGFPPHLGGPFRYMDALGPKACVELLSQMSQQHGNRFAPPAILQRMTAENETFYNRPSLTGMRATE